MAQKNYTYRWLGVTAAYLGQQVPGTGTISAPVPIILQKVTWDETYKADLDAAMASGWEYAYEGTPPPAKTVAQIVPASLSADASSIPLASGWVDVLTSTLVTRGGSSVGVQVSAVADPSVGVGKARVIVNGGAFSNTVVGAASYDIPTSSQGATGFNAPRTIADTPTETTYTFKLQIQATGIAGSVVPRAGTTMTLVETR